MKNLTSYLVVFVLLLFSAILKAEEQEIYTTHKVEKGETVYSISKKYNVTEEAIYYLNPQAKDNISINSILLIPYPQEEQKVIGFENHKVKRKETLFSIAKDYNVTVDDIKKYNKFLYAENLKKGDRLQIPKYQTIKQETSPTVIGKPNTSKNVKTEITHTVKPKETWYGIARMYNTTVEVLKKLNPNIEDNLLIDSQLVVPNKSVLENASIDENYEFYEVQPKEGFYRLKVKFGLSENEIIALNPYTKDGLKEGMIIKIPKVVSVLKNDNINTSHLENFINNKNPKNIVVMLPFQLKSKTADTLKNQKEVLKKNRTLRITLDFYSGVLMAAEFVKEKNISVNINTIDSEGGSKLSDLLHTLNFSDVDAVIGPLLSNNVEEVAQFLKPKNIPVFSPLSNRELNLTSNLIQTIPTIDILVNEVLRYLKTKEQTGNIIVITDAKSSNKNKILSSLSQAIDLSPQGKSYISRAEVASKLVKDKPNFVLLEATNAVLLSNVISTLNGLHNEYNIQLITTDKNDGYDFEDISNKHLANLKFTFPSVNKNYNITEKEAFIISYKNKYGVYPNRFVIRGFDLTLDVLLRLASHTSVYDSFEEHPQTEYLENKFIYTKSSSNGYINQGCYLMQYTTDLNFTTLKE